MTKLAYESQVKQGICVSEFIVTFNHFQFNQDGVWLQTYSKHGSNIFHSHILLYLHCGLKFLIGVGMANCQ